MAQKRRAAPKFASAAFTDVATSEGWGKIEQQAKAVEEEVLPAKGPARSPAEFLEVSSPRKSNLSIAVGFLQPPSLASERRAMLSTLIVPRVEIASFAKQRDPCP